jgi:hypothetical protein
MTNADAIQMIHRMDAADLARVIDAVKLRRTYLTRQNAATLMVGDRVSFAARGMQVLGTVTKINVKTVLVKQSNTATVWKVHASLLKPVQDMSVSG